MQVRMIVPRIAAALALALLLGACGSGPPDIEITDAWARETVSAETAAYMTIRNAGAGDDRLVGVTATAPAKVAKAKKA